MDASAFLSKGLPGTLRPVYLLSGDEDFLKERCRAAIVQAAIGDADPTFALTLHLGDDLDFSTVRNDLATPSFTAPKRIVRVDNADPFVSLARTKLEAYLKEPSPSGVLILSVRTEKANTKLAKAVGDDAFLVCHAPPRAKIISWLTDWSLKQYGKKLAASAAELLLELIGPHLGILDRELDKLSTFVGAQESIDRAAVDRLVGRSRSADVFSILDAIGEGEPGKAVGTLTELLDDGDDPMALLGALGYQVRKLALAGRLVLEGIPLESAFDKAGVPKWPAGRESARKQIQHLGRRRLDKLYDWLLEVDLGCKGNSPLTPRLQLERLLVRLAKPRD